jgi:hypothetical protein
MGDHEKPICNCVRCGKPISHPFDLYFVAHVGAHHHACLPTPSEILYYERGLTWAAAVADRIAAENGAAGAAAQVVGNVVRKTIADLTGAPSVSSAPPLGGIRT